VAGRRGGVAEHLVTAAGLRLETLAVSGIDLARPATAVRAAAMLPGSVLAARRLLRRTAADVVVGAGGYVSVPVVTAAALLRIPVVLMEQNAVPGRATRLLAGRARAVATAFDETGTHLRGAHVVVTGVPVRREVLELAPAPQRPRCTHLLVMGGSQGARTLNRAVAGFVRDILSEHDELRITHQSGALDAEAAQRVAATLPPALAARYTVAAFFTDIAERIAASDLVLMRAGGASLAECAVLGRPMILVPYPHARGHQAHNARPYVAAGAAVAVPDEACTSQRLHSEVAAVVRDDERFRAMGRASAALGRPHAADDLVDLIVGAAERRHSPAP